VGHEIGQFVLNLPPLVALDGAVDHVGVVGDPADGDLRGVAVEGEPGVHRLQAHLEEPRDELLGVEVDVFLFATGSDVPGHQQFGECHDPSGR
jgi:hypothetical protein